MTDQKQGPYLALPASGKGPGVLVLHAWWGLNDFMRGFCDRLAQAGFVALAPDMFSGVVLKTIGDAEHHVSNLDWEHAVPPAIRSAVDQLTSHPAVSGKGLGVVGFSFGGFWSLWLAQKEPDLVRAVTLFYGTNEGSGDFTHSKAAYMGHFAETDPYEGATGVQALKKNLSGANRPAVFYTYPDTGHWFCETDRPDAYNPTAAALAWERTTAFLHERLDGAPGA